MTTGNPTVLVLDARHSLAALRQDSERLDGVYHRRPGWDDASNERSISDHLQGIAVANGNPDRFFLTTSAKGGLLLSGAITRDSGGDFQYVIDQQTGGLQGNHPGGIQALGNRVVVPVYDTNARKVQSSIQLWSVEKQDESGQRLKRFSDLLELDGHHAYCAGITYSRDCGYLLAVGLHEKGRVIGLYRKESDDLLGDGGFVHVGTIRTRKAHRNNISLCVDRAGQICLLGFRLGGRFQALGAGEDKVDVYVLDEQHWGDGGNADAPTRVRRSFTRHLRCRRGGEQPSFRWGASARVLPSGDMEIIACGYQIFRENNQPLFEVDVFRKPDRA